MPLPARAVPGRFGKARQSRGPSSSRRTGLKYDMIESGTTIVRVHADIALKLNPNRDGIKTSSGGTHGQSS